MALTGNNNEQKIWNYLKAAGLNDYGVAGLMGNLYAESGLRPDNLQNTYEGELKYTDAGYTAAVDNGRYTNFVRDEAGYGVAQWTHWSRKEKLLDFAKAARKSIGDLEMQLDFLMEELAESFPSTLRTLKYAKTIRDASDNVLLKFECPADKSEDVKKRRASYGQKYYDKYAGTAAKPATGSTAPATGTGITEAQLRARVVSIAEGWLGCNEADGSHRQIIDLYNSHKPLARGYAMKYTDAWCSTYASAVAIAAGLTDIIPTECGCEKHIELFKKLGAWTENDAHIPSPGDYIFYDWDDSGVGDNTGWSDHVGIVVSVTGSTIKLIEGNISNKVGYRTLQVNAKTIRGWGTPNYAKKAASGSTGGAAVTPIPNTPSTPSASPAGLSVGDVVDFTGTTHYTSSGAGKGSNCKPGKAKITLIKEGAKHPYHVVKVSGGGSTVYGWVDAKDIAGATASVTTHTVVRGDTLWGIAEKYLGNGNRYPEIKTLNDLSSNTIRTGQVLKIPAK